MVTSFETDYAGKPCFPFLIKCGRKCHLEHCPSNTENQRINYIVCSWHFWTHAPHARTHDVIRDVTIYPADWWRNSHIRDVFFAPMFRYDITSQTEWLNSPALNTHPQFMECPGIPCKHMTRDVSTQTRDVKISCGSCPHVFDTDIRSVSSIRKSHQESAVLLFASIFIFIALRFTITVHWRYCWVNLRRLRGRVVLIKELQHFI